MKRIFTFLIVLALIAINIETKAQTNLIANWGANNLGFKQTNVAGSDPGSAGWLGTPTLTWSLANAGGGLRYWDNTTTYTYNGLP